MTNSGGTVTNDVKCSGCGESVEWNNGIDQWRHVRTQDYACRPLCTHVGCSMRATVKLGYHGVTGSGSGFIRTGWACEAHKPKGGIEWA